MDTTIQAQKLPMLFCALVVSLLSILIALTASGAYLLLRQPSAGVPGGLSLPKNRYYAVYVNGGQLFFGQIQTGEVAPYTVLTNVFYVQTKRDEQTQQVGPVLIKRGKELHQPDRMYLNASQIISIEPVGETSRVMELISEANH